MRYWKDTHNDIYITTDDICHGGWLYRYKSEGRSSMIAITPRNKEYLQHRCTELTGANLMLELL